MFKSGECSNCIHSSKTHTEYPCSNCSRCPDLTKRDHMQYKTDVPYSYDSKTAPDVTLKF